MCFAEDIKNTRAYDEIFAKQAANQPIFRLGIAISSAWKRERSHLVKYFLSARGPKFTDASHLEEHPAPFRDVVKPANISYTAEI